MADNLDFYRFDTDEGCDELEDELEDPYKLDDSKATDSEFSVESEKNRRVKKKIAKKR